MGSLTEVWHVQLLLEFRLSLKPTFQCQHLANRKYHYKLTSEAKTTGKEWLFPRSSEITFDTWETLNGQVHDSVILVAVLRDVN